MPALRFRQIARYRWMRGTAIAAFGIVALSGKALAAPEAGEIIGKSVQALRETCYAARMRFLSVQDGGQEREVDIYHVAPDLYRVVPVKNGSPDLSAVYIENAIELVLLRNGTAVSMPERQFALNDAMTTKFMRDLGKDQGVSVLSGQVGKKEVWALRQDIRSKAKYTITVGVDKGTWFPVYLLVSDAQGKARVYFEMLSIDYLDAMELQDSLFIVPELKGSTEKVQAQRTRKSAAAALPESGSSAPVTLPLYPAWLPRGFQLEAIRLVDCPNSLAMDKGPLVVYQLEVYGPQARDMVSIFQTRCKAEDFGLDSFNPDASSGFVVGESGGWFIAVFGSLSKAELEKILEGLNSDSEHIKKLIKQTSRLDQLLSEAVAAGR